MPDAAWANWRSRGSFVLPAVTSCIVGATRPEQLEHNAGASGVKLSEEIVRRIEDVFA